MKVIGSASIAAPPARVWEALRDPETLARAIPGCLSIEPVASRAYQMSVRAEVAAVAGIYQGRVTARETEPPRAMTLHASGRGAPGVVDAHVKVRLVPDGAGTRVDYDADAHVEGAVAAVGRRMLDAAARRSAAEFFAAVRQVLAEAPAAPSTSSTPAAPAAPATTADIPVTTSTAAGTAEHGSVPAAARTGRATPATLAAVAGVSGVTALTGVLLGWLLGRHSHRNGTP